MLGLGVDKVRKLFFIRYSTLSVMLGKPKSYPFL